MALDGRYRTALDVGSDDETTLAGRTGKELWRLWTDHEIFALACQADLNNDSYIDCLAGGRAGVFLAGLLPSPS